MASWSSACVSTRHRAGQPCVPGAVDPWDGRHRTTCGRAGLRFEDARPCLRNEHTCPEQRRRGAEARGALEQDSCGRGTVRRVASAGSCRASVPSVVPGPAPRERGTRRVPGSAWPAQPCCRGPRGRPARRASLLRHRAACSPGAPGTAAWRLRAGPAARDLGRETRFLGRGDVGAGGRAVSLASGADPGVLCDQGVRHAAPLGGGTPWARCPCPQGCESCLAGAQQPHQAHGTETGVHCKQTAVRDLGQSSLWQAGSGQWPGAGSPAGGLWLGRQVGLLQCRSPQRCFGAQRLRWQLGSCVSSSVRGRGGRELGPGGRG